MSKQEIVFRAGLEIPTFIVTKFGNSIVPFSFCARVVMGVFRRPITATSRHTRTSNTEAHLCHYYSCICFCFVSFCESVELVWAQRMGLQGCGLLKLVTNVARVDYQNFAKPQLTGG